MTAGGQFETSLVPRVATVKMQYCNFQEHSLDDKELYLRVTRGEQIQNNYERFSLLSKINQTVAAATSLLAN